MFLRGKHVIVICECVGSSGEVRNENREFLRACVADHECSEERGNDASYIIGGRNIMV
jgi:hypothetical protein